MDWRKWGPHGRVLTLTWTFSDMHLRGYKCEEDQAREALAFGGLGSSPPMGLGLGFSEDEYRGREPFQRSDSA